MESTINFKGKEYSIRVDVNRSFNEPNYFVYIFLENNQMKKGHFVKEKNEFRAFLASSNHTFEPTEYDNELLYAVIEKLQQLLA